jgi:iron complex outermembrane receptor protein
MPADKVGTSLGTEYRLNQEAKMVFKIGADYFLKQNRPAVFETATPDYYLLNASVKYSKYLANQKQINFMLIGNNLLNRIYYDHLSRFKYFGIYNYGINLTLKVNYQF